MPLNLPPLLATGEVASIPRQTLILKGSPDHAAGPYDLKANFFTDIVLDGGEAELNLSTLVEGEMVGYLILPKAAITDGVLTVTTAAIGDTDTVDVIAIHRPMQSK